MANTEIDYFVDITVWGGVKTCQSWIYFYAELLGTVYALQQAERAVVATLSTGTGLCSYVHIFTLINK